MEHFIDAGITATIPSSIVNTVTTTVHETEDEFIFSTLSSYAKDTYNITVEKDELNKAILFIRACQETGTDLRNCYSRAMSGIALYRKGYKDGFAAGMQEARDRLANAFKEKSVW